MSVRQLPHIKKNNLKTNLQLKLAGKIKQYINHKHPIHAIIPWTHYKNQLLSTLQKAYNKSCETITLKYVTIIYNQHNC